jgi:phosphonate transport system substrate-binding protein
MNTIYMMSVSLDFPTQRLSGWSAFCDWLRDRHDSGIQLETHRDFVDQRRAIIAGQVDIVYANPFDASMLVRENGFVPVARPADRRYECILAVAHASGYRVVEDLRPECRVASTGNPDVNLIGLMLLEPADLDLGNIQMVHVEAYLQVAEALTRGEADTGFFLEEAYASLPDSLRGQLFPLVQSRIDDISHVLLLGPRLADRQETLRQILLGMADEPEGRHALAQLGFSGWESMNGEDTEFMIDLMDALKA